MWVIPASLRPMLLKYFHDSVLSGHLGVCKTFHKIASNFWWPKMRMEIFKHFCSCNLCQRAKPAQDACVRLHSSAPCSRPVERLFVDFVGSLIRTKRGNVAILVILDAFSKFVFFARCARFHPKLLLIVWKECSFQLMVHLRQS
jgi:hypothetical protein